MGAAPSSNEAGNNRLTRAVPKSHALLVAVTEHGGNIGNAVARLLVLLDQEGPAALRDAIVEVMASRTPPILEFAPWVAEFALRLPPCRAENL